MATLALYLAGSNHQCELRLVLAGLSEYPTSSTTDGVLGEPGGGLKGPHAPSASFVLPSGAVIVALPQKPRYFLRPAFSILDCIIKSNSRMALSWAGTGILAIRICVKGLYDKRVCRIVSLQRNSVSNERGSTIKIMYWLPGSYCRDSLLC